MSVGDIIPGCILHWEGFKFEDGEEANKFLVLVGCKQGFDYLAVVATSRQRRRTFTPGGHPKEGYYHIPGDGKDWFKKDTWLLVAPPVRISPALFLKQVLEGKITVRGRLR